MTTTPATSIKPLRFSRLVLVDIENLAGRSPRSLTAAHIADLVAHLQRRGITVLLASVSPEHQRRKAR